MEGPDNLPAKDGFEGGMITLLIAIAAGIGLLAAIWLALFLVVTMPMFLWALLWKLFTTDDREATPQPQSGQPRPNRHSPAP